MVVVGSSEVLKGVDEGVRLFIAGMLYGSSFICVAYVGIIALVARTRGGPRRRD